MHKRSISIVALSALAFAVLGAGCGKPSTTGQVTDVSPECQKTDYAVTDLVLENPTTTLSDADAVLTTVKRLGDCDAQSFKVSLKDNGTEFFKSEIKVPNQSNGLYNDWVAATEGEHLIRAEITLDNDADLSNNVKEFKFTVPPIGYLGGQDATAPQRIGANNWTAHAFLVGHAVSVKSLWGEFKKVTDGPIVGEIRKDDAGKPGAVLVQGKNSEAPKSFASSTSEYVWLGVDVDTVLQPGIYWLTFKSQDKGAYDWRGADKNVDGPVDDTKNVTVKTGMEPRGTDWLPRTGDVVYKISALKVGATKAEGPIGLANPASVNCVEKGGQSVSAQRGDLGAYGICLFDDNRQCEEWAMFRGECPVGGLKVAGFLTEQSKYCAITGGQYKATSEPNAEKEAGQCTTITGEVCDADAYYAGTCPAVNAVLDKNAQAQMANPASVNCVDKGGTVDIRKDKDGNETGYCKFSNGKECEEWALFRGECKP